MRTSSGFPETGNGQRLTSREARKDSSGHPGRQGKTAGSIQAESERHRHAFHKAMEDSGCHPEKSLAWTAFGSLRDMAVRRLSILQKKRESDRETVFL